MPAEAVRPVSSGMRAQISVAVAEAVARLRRFFVIDESRVRARVYLHEGLDLDAAEAYWSSVTGVPRGQFNRACRAKADPSIRLSKHEYGCAYLDYHRSRTHREIMGLVRALLSSGVIPG